MIQIDKLGFSYGKIPVLKNITMTLQPGKIYGLLGENGVGKTTLLTLLCGLKKTTDGSIRVDGIDPYKRDPDLLADQYYLADDVLPIPERLPLSRRRQARSGLITVMTSSWKSWHCSKTTRRRR